MKKLFTLCIALLSVTAWAQDYMFVHTATAASLSADLTYIDNPLLNGNPGAQLVFSHVWNPPGSIGVYNDHRTGLYYDSVEGKWGIYNEDVTNMVEDSSYFVYVEQGTEIFQHIADAGNQGSDPSYTVLNHPDINGNPEAQVVASTYYNPNSSRNDFNYGTWYDGANWNLYTEDASSIQFGDAFLVAINSPSTVAYRHVAAAGTVVSNWTNISHPLLDGNSDARFVFFHNWGESGQTSNVVINKTMGAWYTGTNWAIYNEDGTSFSTDAEFDLLIFDPSLGTNDLNIAQVSLAPNPVSSSTTVTATETIKQIAISNVLGQIVKVINGTGTQQTIDLSSLSSGQYFASVTTETGSQVIKLLKQ